MCAFPLRSRMCSWQHQPQGRSWSWGGRQHKSFIPVAETCRSSPLRQAKQEVSLWPITEACHFEPACRSVAILISWPCAHAERVLYEFATSRCRSELGCISQTADELHLRERSSGSRGECARGARHLEAEGLHLDVSVVISADCAVMGNEEMLYGGRVLVAFLEMVEAGVDETRPVSVSCRARQTLLRTRTTPSLLSSSSPLTQSTSSPSTS